MAIVTVLDHSISGAQDLETSMSDGPSRDEAGRRRQFVRHVSSPREPGHNQRVVESPPAKS